MNWTKGRPARGPGPAGVSWSGPINWGLFRPKRPAWAVVAVGQGAPRGGPPLAAVAGTGREGGGLQGRWATWPDAGGGHGPQGGGASGPQGNMA